MAIGIHFDKAKAEHLVQCLNLGTPIEDITTTQDMLALIGACRYVCSTRAPSVPPGTRQRKLPYSRRQAVRESLAHDIDAAIDWHTEATRMVIEGEYDARFEPHHYAVAEQAEGEHRWKVVVTQGSKSHRPLQATLPQAHLADCPVAARAG